MAVGGYISAQTTAVSLTLMEGGAWVSFEKKHTNIFTPRHLPLPDSLFPTDRPVRAHIDLPADAIFYDLTAS